MALINFHIALAGNRDRLTQIENIAGAVCAMAGCAVHRRIGVGWVVIGSIIGGYLMVGGHLAILFQPAEIVIIGGSGIGAFITANRKEVITAAASGIVGLVKGPKYGPEDYLELLTLQYQVFRMAKSKGMLSLESHIENPEASTLFNQFPNFASDHHAVEFFCDYLRNLKNSRKVNELGHEDIN